MKLSLHARSLPGRIATGAFILHAGLEKWSGDETRAAGIHGMAAGAYPVFNEVPPPIFLKALAASEIATGALLLSPFVSDATAGAALTAFSGGLLGMYWRTETLQEARQRLADPGRHRYEQRRLDVRDRNRADARFAYQLAPQEVPEEQQDLEVLVP